MFFWGNWNSLHVGCSHRLQRWLHLAATKRRYMYFSHVFSRRQFIQSIYKTRMTHSQRWTGGPGGARWLISTLRADSGRITKYVGRLVTRPKSSHMLENVNGEIRLCISKKHKVGYSSNGIFQFELADLLIKKLGMCRITKQFRGTSSIRRKHNK